MVRKHLDVMNTDQSFFFGSIHRKLNWIMQAHVTASDSAHNILLAVKPHEVMVQCFDLNSVPT